MQCSCECQSMLNICELRHVSVTADTSAQPPANKFDGLNFACRQSGPGVSNSVTNRRKVTLCMTGKQTGFNFLQSPTSDPRPNPTHQKAKKLDPTQPNPTQPAGRPRQRRRRGRRASVGVVEDVARLQTTGATSRRCLGRRRSTAEGGRSDLTSVPRARRQRPSRHGGVVESPGVARQLRTTALFPS